MELLTGLALEALASVRLPIGKWKDESLARRLPLFAEASTPALPRVEIFRRGVRFRWAETSNAVQSFEKGHCEREAVCSGKVETVWRVHVDLERILFSWFRLISALVVSARRALSSYFLTVYIVWSYLIFYIRRGKSRKQVRVTFSVYNLIFINIIKIYIVI